MVQNINAFTAEIDPKQLSYVPDRRLRTVVAADQAIQIVNELRRVNGPCAEPNEKSLSTALQTCAYRAARLDRGEGISPRERRQWAHRYKLLREDILEQNLGLVYSMMRRFKFEGGDCDDLLSNAMFALSRAVERFNPWKGYRFSTYACTAIVRALRNGSRRSHRFRREFPLEYDVPFEVSEPIDTQTDLYIERLRRRVLDEKLGELDAMETRALAQRFPLHDERGSTLGVNGQAIGLSEERVRQIQNGAPHVSDQAKPAMTGRATD